jgi:RNA polymerase sigma-70 factor, ECF subfamily
MNPVALHRAILTETFEQERPRLRRLAYSLLGTLAEADDAVQETAIRFAASGHEAELPEAWLTTVLTRICLDVRKSARFSREQYTGPWLPEPWPNDAADPATSPEERVTRSEAVSFALMVLLEQLSASERAAYLLREIMGYEYGEIASILNQAAPACRQLVHRAGEKLSAGKKRNEPTPAAHNALLLAFSQALSAGDATALEELLTHDVELLADGGGLRTAATKPLRSPETVSAFLIGLAKNKSKGLTVALQNVNGLGAFVLFGQDGVELVLQIAVQNDQIGAIYITRNPNKLTAFVSRPRSAS